jgi:hypothetical protein
VSFIQISPSEVVELCGSWSLGGVLLETQSERLGLDRFVFA